MRKVTVVIAGNRKGALSKLIQAEVQEKWVREDLTYRLAKLTAGRNIETSQTHRPRDMLTPGHTYTDSAEWLAYCFAAAIFMKSVWLCIAQGPVQPKSRAVMRERPSGIELSPAFGSSADACRHIWCELAVGSSELEYIGEFCSFSS